jgi:hypothetical protein
MTLFRRRLLAIALVALYVAWACVLTGCAGGKRSRSASAPVPSAAFVRGTVATAAVSVRAATRAAGAARESIRRAEAAAATIVPAPEHAPALDTVRLSLAAAREQVDDLTSKLLTAETDLARAEARAADLDRQIAVQTSALEAATRERDDFRIEVDQLRAEIADVVRQRNTLILVTTIAILVAGGLLLFIFRRPIGLLLGFLVP